VAGSVDPRGPTVVSGPGWAGGTEAHAAGLAYLPSPHPVRLLEDEPASAVCDWWESPHPMALAADVCLRIRQQAVSSEELIPAANGTYYPQVDPDTVSDVIARMRTANQIWWDLDITRWDVRVKQYVTGQHHPEHTDWHPAGGAGRKLVGGVQLSAAGDYTGGDFRFRWAHYDLVLPRAVGTLTVFPGWIAHRVTPVVSGERWALIVNGWGPPLR
jgi:hypothetical protein